MSVVESEGSRRDSVPDADSTISWRVIATDAIRYWEVRRVVYNLVLAAIVVRQAVHVWPASRDALDLATGLTLFVLATVANLLYCAAYPIDVFVQLSAYRERWRRLRGILFVLGLTFAAALTYFWAAAMIPRGAE